jgi:hypothetical protein
MVERWIVAVVALAIRVVPKMDKNYTTATDRV